MILEKSLRTTLELLYSYDKMFCSRTRLWRRTCRQPRKKTSVEPAYSHCLYVYANWFCWIEHEFFTISSVEGKVWSFITSFCAKNVIWYSTVYRGSCPWLLQVTNLIIEDDSLQIFILKMLKLHNFHVGSACIDIAYCKILVDSVWIPDFNCKTDTDTVLILDYIDTSMYS